MRRKLFGAIVAICIGWFQAEAYTGNVKASCFSVDHVARELIFSQAGCRHKHDLYGKPSVFTLILPYSKAKYIDDERLKGFEMLKSR